jgi:molybdopterin-guanine dinucleotide biosynthesis adapter protein
MRPPLFGITGWKNSGKTTLAAALIRELTRRGYAVTALKHAHKSFEIDHPGRDSFKLREAGAARVVVSSPKRWAIMRELRGEPEARFEELLDEAGLCDLVVIEGFKDQSFPKLEIRRDGAASREPLARQISHVVAIASDRPQDEEDDLPIFHFDDVASITDFVITHLRLASTS